MNRRARLTEAEKKAFIAMWETGVSVTRIADALELELASVNGVRTRLGLPCRRQRAITAEAGASGGDAPAAREPRVPKMPPHPYWDALKDLAVIQAGGRHRDVDALAAELGKGRAAVLQRWHQLRAA